MGAGELVATFKPHQNFKPKAIPARGQLQRFYAALKSPKERAIFLMYAATGLRKHGLISITLREVDLEKRMILPKCDGSQTRRTWVTFLNEGAEQAMKEYLGRMQGVNTRFPTVRREGGSKGIQAGGASE